MPFLFVLKILHSITCGSCVSVNVLTVHLATVESEQNTANYPTDTTTYMHIAIFRNNWDTPVTDLMLGRCLPESLFLSGKVLLYSFQMAL